MRSERILALALLASCTMAQAWASDDQPLPPKYVHIGGVLAKTDENRLTDDGSGVQFNFGIPVNQNVSFELRFSTFVFDALDQGTPPVTIRPTSDFYHRTMGADLVYAFGDRNEVTPYVLVGAGLAYNDVLDMLNSDPDHKDAYSGYANLGIGLTSGFFDLDWLRGRLEARAVYDSFDGGQVDYQFSGGIEMPIGVVRTDERIVEKVVQLPAPAPVVREVEVVKEVPVEVVKQVEVIKQVPVEVVRVVEVAPPDADQDGIADVRDNCPATPAGATTDNHGCVLKSAVIRLENLLFETNSSVIKASSDSTLSMAVEFLKNQPQVKVEVAGHTDNVGKAAKNKALSLQRAKAVARALKARGVRNQLTPAGYGASKPVVPNNSESNRQRNRRVELKILSS